MNPRKIHESNFFIREDGRFETQEFRTTTIYIYMCVYYMYMQINEVLIYIYIYIFTV